MSVSKNSSVIAQSNHFITALRCAIEARAVYMHDTPSHNISIINTYVKRFLTLLRLRVMLPL